MDWLNNLPLLIAALLLPFGWKMATSWAAKAAAGKFAQAIDKALELGDDEWDAITVAVIRKLEREIPDGVTPEHPKILNLAKKICEGEGLFGLLKGQEKRVASLLAAVARSIDKRAKKGGHGQTEEG